MYVSYQLSATYLVPSESLAQPIRKYRRMMYNFGTSPGALVLRSTRVLVPRTSRVLLAPLSWLHRHGNRSTVCSCASVVLLALIVVFNDLADVSLTLSLVGWGPYAVQVIGRLNKNRIVDDNFLIGPTGWETVGHVNTSSVLQLIN